MPLQDTGLDFYESSMRPVRAGIQSIVTRADQNRKELEAQRQRLAAEERLNKRGIEREQRAEAASIRTEERHAATKEDEDREQAVTVAHSYGVATHEPDGSPSSTKVIEERNKRAELVRPKRQLLMANMRWLEQIPSIPKETIEQIKNDRAGAATGDFGMSPDQLEAIWLTHKDTIAMLRKGGIDKLRKETPGYVRDLYDAKYALTDISKRLNEIRKSPVLAHAQMVADNFRNADGTIGEGHIPNPDRTGAVPGDFANAAGAYASTHEMAQPVTVRVDLGPARATQVKVGDTWKAVADLERDAAAGIEEAKAALAKAHAGGEIDIKGIMWALSNKPTETIQGNWPVAVNDKGQPTSIYFSEGGNTKGNISDEEREVLWGSYNLGIAHAIAQARARGEYGHWAGMLDLEVDKLKFKPEEKEIDGLLLDRRNIRTKFPELWRWDSLNQVMNEPLAEKPPEKPPEKPEEKEKPTVPVVETPPPPPTDFSNALEALKTASVATAVAGGDSPLLNDDGTPWNDYDVAPPFDVAQPTPGLAAAEARVALPLDQFIEQAKRDDPPVVDYWDMTPEERAKEDAPLLAQEKDMVAANPYGLPLATDEAAALFQQRHAAEGIRLAEVAADPHGKIQQAKRVAQEQRQHESTPEYYIEQAVGPMGGGQRDQLFDTAARIWLQSDRPPNPPRGNYDTGEFLEAVKRVEAAGLDDQDFNEIMSGQRSATSEEAKEGLAFLRDTLYKGESGLPRVSPESVKRGLEVAAGGSLSDYDPRLQQEIAVRGQLGQAPPLLGRPAPTPPPAAPPVAPPQATPTAPQGYGELREAPLPVPPRRWAIPPETPADRARKARLFHLYKNPLQGRKKGGQRLMEMSARNR